MARLINGRGRVLASAVLGVSLIATLCGFRSGPAPATSDAQLTSSDAQLTSSDARLTSATSPRCVAPVSTWSLRRRLNQLLMVSGQFSSLGASAAPASSGVGAFVLFGQPPAGSGPTIKAGLSALANDASSRGEVVPWMSTDEEGGSVARLSNVTGALPSPRQMASQWTTSQVKSALASHGSAMRSLGITMDLAPVLGTASSTDTISSMDTRSFSDNPYTVAAYGLAFADGLRAGGVVPVVKHFPGLGHASANTDLRPATDPPLSQLKTDDLIPFERAINAGLPVVMVSHAIVPGLTGGLPASLSPATYNYLRGTLHFRGVTLTDDLSAGAISGAGYSQPAAAVKAIESGADMAMIDASAWPATLTALEQAVGSGALPISTVDAAVRSILTAKGMRACTAGVAATPQGNGYWLTTGAGAVKAFGGAGYYGSLADVHLNQPIVGMAPTPDGRGYWLVAADGGVFNFGDAGFYGSLGNIHLNQPVVGIAPTPDGRGYWLVAADGGVFPFGDATFYGSTGNIHLNKPVVGMVGAAAGHGYWLVATDGGIFNFGDATFYGSTGNVHLNAPVLGMAATSNRAGYWLAATDGGIFNFGDATFYGSGA